MIVLMTILSTDVLCCVSKESGEPFRLLLPMPTCMTTKLAVKRNVRNLHLPHDHIYVNELHSVGLDTLQSLHPLCPRRRRRKKNCQM